MFEKTRTENVLIFLKDMKRKSIHWCVKMHVAASQRFRCGGDKKRCVRWAVDDGVFGLDAFEIDHQIPLSEGGSNETSNLVAICPSCHAIKSREERMKRFAKGIDKYVTPKTHNPP
mgnify:FL=1|tara:strand:- start:6 stop:353 length:348 start_codon:yes stop_codon:yes gene_type:complete